MRAVYTEMSLEEAAEGGEGKGRKQAIVAVVGLEYSGREEGEGAWGGYWKGATEGMQDCTGALSVHSGW